MSRITKVIGKAVSYFYRDVYFYCLRCTRAPDAVRVWPIREGHFGTYRVPCDSCGKEINPLAKENSIPLFEGKWVKESDEFIKALKQLGLWL